MLILNRLIGFGSVMRGSVFPTVAGTNTSNSGSSTVTSHPVKLPAGIVANDLLVFFVSVRAGSSRTLTTPSGWSVLYNAVGPGDLVRVAAYYKVASGSEGATVTLSGSGALVVSANSYSIRDYEGTPEASTPATGTSSSANASDLAPTWGIKNTLWITACHTRPDGSQPTTPTNYGNAITDSGGTSSNTSRMTTARRELAAASENVGAWGLSTSSNWAAVTIAIRG